MKRLDLDLAAAEVEMLRAEVSNALEEREHRAEIARQVVPSQENEESVRRSWEEQAEKAARDYKKLRTRFLTQARELMTARQQLGLNPNWEQDRRDESPSETPSAEQPGESPTGQSGSHPSGAAIGSVDIDAVLKRYNKVQKIKDDLARDREAAKQRLAKTQAQVEELTSMLEKFVPDTVDYNVRENQITELKQRLGTEQDQAQREDVRRQARIAASLYEEIRAVITKVAGAKGLDYVVKVSPGPLSDADPIEAHDVWGRSVIYANPRNDLTEEVIRELNRKFEAGGAKLSP
jgi:Skp family chaperone for outer membrane proteins